MSPECGLRSASGKRKAMSRKRVGRYWLWRDARGTRHYTRIRTVTPTTRKMIGRYWLWKDDRGKRHYYTRRSNALRVNVPATNRVLAHTMQQIALTIPRDSGLHGRYQRISRQLFELNTPSKRVAS